jgi:outer membrane protein assembly factor BamB
VSADGFLHTLGQGSGKDVAKPVAFLPANALVSDLIAVNEVVYAATLNGCGGVPDGVWSIDLGSEDKVVKSWKTNGGSPVGAPAFAADGTVFVALGPSSRVVPGGYADAVVALDPKDLTVKDWFIGPSAGLASSPVLFKVGTRNIVAQLTKDGTVVLLDQVALGAADHRSALYKSSPLAAARTDSVPGGLATWEAADATRWLLVPTEASVVALKVVDVNGQPTLQPGWTKTMDAPLTPLVVNGVVFAAASGEFHPTPGTSMTAAERVRRSGRAVLYALDGTTGRELWTSGNAIASFVHGQALWASIGQVHLGTYDNTVYAFGFSLERH